MDIQAQKAIIIEQFNQVNDINLINAIKNMLDYAVYRQQENIDIPEDHQELVLDQFQKSRKDPKRLMDWDDDQQPGFGKSFRTQPLNK